MRRTVLAAVLVAALGAAAGVYVTSSRPDGLEHASATLGLDARPPAGAASSRARRSLLALGGALAAAGLTLGAGYLLRRGRPPRPPGG